MKRRRGAAPSRECAGRVRCSRCRKWLLKDEFRRDKRAVSGCTGYCKNCSRLYQRELAARKRAIREAEKLEAALINAHEGI